MKTSDIGLIFDDKLSRKAWADIAFHDGNPDELWFGTVLTPLGQMTIIGHDTYLCYLGFEKNRSIEKCLHFFPSATLIQNDATAKKMAKIILDIWAGKQSKPLDVMVRGTPFQKKIWSALMKIPTGHAVSYGTVANFIGSPKAFRAVGSAVGANPISLLIPCHRVVQQSGKIENYGWGDKMKQDILRCESGIAS